MDVDTPEIARGPSTVNVGMRPYTEVPFNARASSSSSSTLFRH